MTTKRRKDIALLNFMAVILVLLLTASLFLNFKNTNKTIAGTNEIEITIDKVTTVSIYAFGPEVEFVESTNDYDIYTAEIGTTVRLQAVNETRIFTDWVITSTDTEQVKALDGVNDLANNIINFVVTETTGDLTVTVNRRNAMAEDYGKYMMDRFVIASEEDLLALQNILDGSYNEADFALYYESSSLYNTNEKMDLLREDLRYGYFLVSNNFTVFNSNFTGIGKKEKPFQGIVCGKNTTNSSLFITITDQEQAGESSYGLFKYLGNEAVIRNLIVNTTIGITPTSNASTKIYAGGLAGVIDRSTLIDVEVSANIGIESNNANYIYAGGLAGELLEGSGIDSISDVVYNGTESKWLIVSKKNGSITSAGLIAGTATDSYIKEVDINVTNQIVDLTNNSVTNTYTNSKLYLGNIFGSYIAASYIKTIDDVMIMGDGGETLRTTTTNGEAMVGGLIGYVDADQTGTLKIERVYYRVLGSKNEYSASSVNASNVTNLYAGGVIGYVNGNKVEAIGEFKNRLQTIDLGNSETGLVANYLFEGDYEVKTTQNGKSLTTSNGKAISGGVIGKGYINLNGSQEIRTSLALVSPTSSLLVEATQSQSTTTTGLINDIEHASAALIYGSVENDSISASNIDIYTNNTTIQTIREIGSLAIGDLHTGGFVGYANGSDFSNIGLYYNDSALLVESLSYVGQNTSEGKNSAFCGGFAGELVGNSSLTNIKFAGYNTVDFEVVGTNSHLESIQNTKPAGNNTNYTGENYIGGMVGRIQHVTLNNCIFEGSEANDDYIRMSGHRSPDSAFCGGIVGLIRTATTAVPSSVLNCKVKNTEVIGNATNFDNTYNNPDIYVGGIVGAAYLHNTDSTVEISNCHLQKSTVYALGNELLATYAAGIIAGATWSSSLSIEDCYVTDSIIRANTSTNMNDDNEIESSAAGIVALVGAETNIDISNCVVIDTNIDANVESQYTYINAYSAGISAYTESTDYKPTIDNCYSNAIVTASHSANNGISKIYAIAYNATIETSTKSIETTTTKVTYVDFELQNFTFETVSSETGTYRIKNSSDRYIRIDWFGNVSTSTNTNRATTFTYENGNLVYNGKYVNFDVNGNITYSNTAYDFSSIEKTIEEEIQGTQSITSNQTYYLRKNVKNNLDSLGTAVGTGPFGIPLGENVNPYNNYNYLYGFDGSGQKLYIEILDKDSSFTVNNNKNEVISVTSNKDGDSSLAHIWINARADGSPDVNGELFIPDHDNKEEAASYGWFIFDYVLLYTGDLASISSDLSNINTSYTNGNVVYEYGYGDVDGDSNSEHYLENTNNSSDKILNNYIENEVQNNIKEFTFKVYDNMLALNVKFEITHFGANYKLLFADASGNLIDDAEFKLSYGNMQLELLQKHYSQGNDFYELVYKPNENIESDLTFYVRFIGGNNTISALTTFKINLVANKLQLVGVTYADYTPPLNYYEDDNLLGDSIAYHLYADSVTKFIPVFTKSNDLVQGITYISESNIEKCAYSVDNTTYFSVLTNGELTVGSTVGQSCVLTVSYNGVSINVNILSVTNIPVSYTIVGADYEGLNHATNTTDFYFEQSIRSNYSGVPTVATIVIGSTTYDITSNPNAYDGIKVYEGFGINGDPITKYNADATGYTVTVSEDLLIGQGVDSVSVNIEYATVYTITFKLQCEAFNDNFDKSQLTKTFKITSGTSFKTFFGSGAGSNKQLILDWVESAKIFGYVFTGFYLVDDATSMNSYGISFDDLTNSAYIVNSSNTFYARWSYLIEIVESPGTYVKTGFNSAFMQEYIDTGFTRAIQIPINANQGYIFRVDTDTYYNGRAEVEAYVVTIDGSGNKQMIPIPIDTYQGNEDLYFIRPEDITGYLVLMTTVSNSEIIVGEHTSAVTENITTEDGIITFKYVVNHYNDGDNKSYIYNLSKGSNYYQTLCKEFVLDFYKQSTHTDLSLPDNTEIRVYYNAYVDGSNSPSKTIVGTYTTHNDDRVYLTEFKLLDLETDAFSKFKTFGELLEGTESVTEVYYFTITPPNGYSKKVMNEMANYLVECGYVYEKVDGDDVEYLEGLRSQKELANEHELGTVISGENNYESAKQEKVYHIIPTRDTSLTSQTENDITTYTFTDNKTFNVFDIILTDTQKFPNFHYISLYDDERQSILESSIMSFNIKELRLNLGYRLGKLDIYGKTSENASWEKVTTIDVTSAIHQEYTIDFCDVNGDYPYYAFKIDNISSNEIRLYGIDVVSRTNGVVYEGNVENFEEKGIIDGKHYSSLQLPIVGDSRHDGKVFVLAIQLEDKTDPSIIISDIIGDIYLNVNDIGLGINHFVDLNDSRGKNTAYINLSSIVEVLNVSEINFNISIPEEYAIHSVQLLEVTNEFKPSSGEVRVEYNYEHTHRYIDGICKCGAINGEYVDLVDEFATMLVSDFNTAGGNSTTTINEFSTTSKANMQVAWKNATRLYKYQWFFYFIKEELTMVATANNVLNDDNYLNTIELLNNMIISETASTMFTRGDYTNATEILCYYIHALINKTKLNTFTVPSEYSKLMIDYSDATNRARFLNAYEKSKYTIRIADYNNSALISGGYTGAELINIWYLADKLILNENNLRYQNKILLKYISDDIYQVIGTDVKVSSSATNIVTTLQDQWTHVIATASAADYQDFLDNLEGKYIKIDPLDIAAGPSKVSLYQTIYSNIKSFTYDRGFEVQILDIAPTSPPESEKVLIVDPNLDGGYSSISDAINAAEEGDTVLIASGTYDEEVTIDKAITLIGANAGVNPVTQERSEETVFEKDIVVNADGVVIDGIKLEGDGRIKGSDEGNDGIVIQNVVSANSTINETVEDRYDAPIYLYSSSGDVEYTNVVINQVKYEDSSGRAMILYGNNINGLTITNSYFSTDATTNMYNDAIKIYATDGTYGIKGDVLIANNYFENFRQYVLWFGEYGEGNYKIINNTFVDCGVDYAQWAATILFQTYDGVTSGMVTISIEYNTLTDSCALTRLNYNSSRTSETQVVNVNYNKFYNCISTYYIENRNTYQIDARYNYYGITPTTALFYRESYCKISDPAIFEPYYENDSDVPVYSGE